MVKSLVIGGAGFIGSHLVKYLKESGKTVKVIDNFSTALYNDYNGLADEIYKADIIDKSDKVDAMIKEADEIYYLAAKCSTGDFILYPFDSFNITLTGLYKVLRDRKPSAKIIYFSTSEVYDDDTLEDSALSVKIDKRCGYDVGKLAGEALLYSYQQQERDLNYVVIRPFNVYGSRQINNEVIPKFLVQAINDEPITIYNKGTQSRTFTHIDDFMRALDLILTRGSERAYNICSHETFTINDLVLKIQHVIGKKLKIEHVFRDTCEIHRRTNLSQLLYDEFDFLPRVGLAEGIRETYRWLIVTGTRKLKYDNDME